MATADPLPPHSNSEPRLDKPVEMPLGTTAPAVGGSVVDPIVHQVDGVDAVDKTKEESNDNKKTQAGAEDGTNGKVESPKMSHKEKQLMDRLGAAIDKAIAAGPAATGTSGGKDYSEKRARWFINASFNNSDYYVIPWAACHSWQVVEVLLKEWFREEEKILQDITNGDITIESLGQGFVHPQTWEKTIGHRANVTFVPHSNYNEEAHVDAKYESRVQYQVNYYQKTRGENGVLLYLGKSSHDKPVEFEVTYDLEKLPALEETKDVEKSHDRKAKKSEDLSDGKKAKLGPLDRVTSTRLRIHSPFLHNILKAVIECTATPPDGDFVGLGSGDFFHPYYDLYHHMADLLKYKTEESGLRAKHSEGFNQQCDEHIDLLMKYLNAQVSVPLKEFNSRLVQKTPVVAFATYWLLLKPGTDVYVRDDDGSLNAYVVHSVMGGVSERDGKNVRASSNYNVSVWNLAFDGTHISPRLRDVEVSVFDNVREVTSLPVIPVRFIDDFDERFLKEKLISRGRKYFLFSKRPSFLQYTGQGLKKGAKRYKRSRVVVAHTMAPWNSEELDELVETYHVPTNNTETIRQSIRVPSCECKECTAKTESQEVYAKEKFSDYHKILPNNCGELTAHQYMIMASHMFSFSLKDRSYDLLAVDGLEEPMMVQTAIDNLVMEANNKELIKAIARIYTDSDQTDRFSADFIQGKGEGQIILLHGPPGTGKTLTAESVAEYTKRPLLSITAADLGHEPDQLEKSLLRYFKMASDWDAIVLLDEADVYLEQRTTHDLKRNSIVSVFLRALDYFQGILFLTTNRVGQFDEAFMSRIHLSLGYEPLTNAARVKIWDNLFKKLQDDHKRGGPEIGYEYDAKRYVKSEDVQDLAWNGREIRNAFQTAVALAVFDAKHKQIGGPPEITENHLKQVVSMSSAFRKYMVATHSGMDSSTWALKHGNREDRFPNTPARQTT